MSLFRKHQQQKNEPAPWNKKNQEVEKEEDEGEGEGGGGGKGNRVGNDEHRTRVTMKRKR